MGAFFVYIVKSAVCLALFYLFYRLLLSKETFHRLNRLTLLVILGLSCVIPFIEVTVKEPMEVSQQFLSWEELLLMTELNSTATVADQPTFWAGFPWRELMLMLYVAGIGFFLLRSVWSMIRMLRLIQGGRMIRHANGMTLIAHQKNIAPFSWMKFVVIAETDLQENGEAILAHECAHISKWHSIDLLIADLCIFLQWFNPASWLLKQELQNIHEYEADECVINQGIDAKRYQLLLIKKAVGTRLYSMANSFNHSSLKKRITMMLKKKSNPWARVKYLYVFPLAAVAVATFARPEISNELDEISAVKVNDFAAIMKVDEVKSAEITPSARPAETIQVKGRVLDKENNPIVGATVVIVGTNQGTVTDLNGNFVLRMEQGSSLQVAYIGLATKTVKVTEATDRLQVVLEADNSNLEGKTIGKISSIKTSDPVADEDPVFQVVEQMPEYPGGMAECFRFLGQNIKYPLTAQQARTEGKVIVQFVVDKDGSIINPQIVRSVSKDLDGEAIRVISIMPKWKPGMQKGKPVPVRYTVPVTFRLSRDAGAEGREWAVRINQSTRGTVVKLLEESTKITGKTPLVVVDGVRMPYEKLKEIDVTTIESIHVMTEQAGVKTYGEDAKNGVVVVVTKNKQPK